MSGYISLQKEWNNREDLKNNLKVFKNNDPKGLFQPKLFYDSIRLVEAVTSCSKGWIFTGPGGKE